MVEIKLEETTVEETAANKNSNYPLSMTCCSAENCDNFFSKTIEQVACEESSGGDGIFYCGKCIHISKTSSDALDEDAGSWLVSHST